MIFMELDQRSDMLQDYWLDTNNPMNTQTIVSHNTLII